MRTENTLHFYVIFITRTTHSCEHTEFTVEFMRIYALIVHKSVLKNAQIQYVHKKEYSPRKKEYIKIECGMCRLMELEFSLKGIAVTEII